MVTDQLNQNLNAHDFRRALNNQKKISAGQVAPLFTQIQKANADVDTRTAELKNSLARKDTFETIKRCYKNLVQALTQKLGLELETLDRYENDRDKRKFLSEHLIAEYKKTVVLIAAETDKALASF